jgi:hypothetical protein
MKYKFPNKVKAFSWMIVFVTEILILLATADSLDYVTVSLLFMFYVFSLQYQ